MSRRLAQTLLPAAAGVVLLAMPLAVYAASPQASPSLPPGIVITTQDTALTANAGKAITFPVDVMNNTSNVERIHLNVASAPNNWQPVFQDRGYDVSQIDLLPGKSDTLTFQVTPPATTPAGQSHITLEAATAGGLSTSLGLTVGITTKPAGNLKLTTDYPILKGAAGTKFQFKATIANNTGKDNTFNLEASPPNSNWLVTFQPAYGTKQISSLAVKSAQTQDVNVNVTPPSSAKPGSYPINVKVSDSAGDSATASLKVSLIGDYKLNLTTPSQRLNTHATAGQAKQLSIVVANTGTAPVRNITLSATNTPSGWNMTFKPAKIDSLDPGTMTQVQATLTPSAKAIAGDYSVNLSATSTDASVNKNFRVTVQTPTIWGWVGIGVVVVVIGGLVWLFQGYSRR